MQFKKTFLWMALISLVTTYYSVEAPLRLMFYPESNSFLLFINLGLAILLLYDALIHQRESKWFMLYFLTALPYDLCFFLSPGLLQYLTLAKVLRAVTLIHTYQVLNSLTSVTTTPRLFRLLLIVLTAAVGVHLVTCGWLMLNPTSDLAPSVTYLRALYWSITTLTTTGYGDITPTTDAGRVFTIVVMMTGFSAFGIIVGNISNLIMAKNKHREANKEKIEDLALFMKHYEVPRNLQFQVFNYHKHRLQQRLSENDSKIIADLPHALQNELGLYMKIKLISKLPVFIGLSEECLKHVCLNLGPVSFSAAQMVIHKGDDAKEMYIIDQGELQVLNDNGEVVAVLKQGQCFGEIALLMDLKRTANVLAKTYCDAFEFRKDDFVKLASQFPELDINFRKIMQNRTSDKKKSA